MNIKVIETRKRIIMHRGVPSFRQLTNENEHLFHSPVSILLSLQFPSSFDSPELNLIFEADFFRIS